MKLELSSSKGASSLKNSTSIVKKKEKQSGTREVRERLKREGDLEVQLVRPLPMRGSSPYHLQVQVRLSQEIALKSNQKMTLSL